jgi:hypothetical protein
MDPNVALNANPPPTIANKVEDNLIFFNFVIFLSCLKLLEIGAAK